MWKYQHRVIHGHLIMNYNLNSVVNPNRIKTSDADLDQVLVQLFTIQFLPALVFIG